MKPIKAIAIVSVLASIISVAIYLSFNSQMESVAAVDSDDTTATEHQRHLCERLIRFGQVAFERGQIAEAKHFFQKAIKVDPSHPAAWKKYNMAFLALISAKVETDPAFLPNFSTDAGASAAPPVTFSDTPGQTSEDLLDDDDDC